MAAKKKKSGRATVFKQIKEKYQGCDLRAQVIEVLALKAASINRAGIDAQLKFLEKEAGLAWLKSYYL